MASPQTENGYTRIANEILEVFAKTDMNGTQRRILDVVVRQTYGYKRIAHEISISFIAKATNIHHKQIQRELNTLISRNILTVVSEATFNKSRGLAINKDYERWLISGEVANQLPPNEIDTHTGSELVPSRGSELAPQIKKERNSKEMCNINFEELWKLYPNRKGKGQVKDSKKIEVYKIGEEFKRCISRYVVDVEKRRKEGFKDLKYQNGSTFFNSGYVDYLDANQTEDKPVRVLVRKDVGYLE